ncbi:MAG: plastocyanin/azurin family copper-binding protein [Acidimicrobiia bacterium]
MRPLLRGALAATVAAAALAACGGDDGGGYREPKGQAQEQVSIQGGNFFFDPDRFELPAGVNQIELVGEQGVHTLLIEGVDGYELRVEGSGDTEAKKVDLEPGEYVVYCDIPGHRSQGMEGTLTVE